MKIALLEPLSNALRWKENIRNYCPSLKNGKTITQEQATKFSSHYMLN